MEDKLLEATSRSYRANVISVYDGDTITVDIDLGLDIVFHSQSIRLYGINTPSVRGTERPSGLTARDYLRSLILGKQIRLYTVDNDKRGKYGRLLGILKLDEMNINQHLLDSGYAVPYGA